MLPTFTYGKKTEPMLMTLKYFVVVTRKKMFFFQKYGYAIPKEMWCHLLRYVALPFIKKCVNEI